jgi:hypothetical protein
MNDRGKTQSTYITDSSPILLCSIEKLEKMPLHNKTAFVRLIPTSKIKSEIKQKCALLPAPFVWNFKGKQILNILSAQMQTMIQEES